MEYWRVKIDEEHEERRLQLLHLQESNARFEQSSQMFPPVAWTFNQQAALEIEMQRMGSKIKLIMDSTLSILWGLPCNYSSVWFSM